jgi:hypothetical protein
MKMETAIEALGGIEASQCAAQVKELLLAVVSYAQIRARWSLAPLEQRREMDRRRSAAHDALIDACNVLSRKMHRGGEDNRWREIITDDRKEIGDFACFVHAILGVRAR